MDSLTRFVTLSAALTGYTGAELHGTGMVRTYYSVLTDVLGGETAGQLLSAWSGVVTQAAGDQQATVQGLRKHVLEDETLGPVARNLVTLWYLGQWTEMPASWRAAHGASASDLTHVVSSEAYRQGLVWKAIGAHPMGAEQQGYGAWALPPHGDLR